MAMPMVLKADMLDLYSRLLLPADWYFDGEFEFENDTEDKDEDEDDTSVCQPMNRMKVKKYKVTSY